MTKAPGGGVAAHAGVDHAIGVALVREARLEPRRIRLVGGDPEARGQAVAERHDHALAARLGHADARERERREDQRARDETAHAPSVV
jgi:hypothetical protein